MTNIKQRLEEIEKWVDEHEGLMNPLTGSLSPTKIKSYYHTKIINLLAELREEVEAKSEPTDLYGDVVKLSDILALLEMGGKE